MPFCPVDFSLLPNFLDYAQSQGESSFQAKSTLLLSHSQK